MQKETAGVEKPLPHLLSRRADGRRDTFLGAYLACIVRKKREAFQGPAVCVEPGPEFSEVGLEVREEKVVRAEW